MRITWANYSQQWFWSRMLGVTQHGFGEFHVGSVFRLFELFPQNRYRLRRLHILIYATQLSCYFQCSHCTFVTIRFRPFAGLFINLAVCTRGLFPQSASIFGLVEQALQRMPFFTEWVVRSFQVIFCTAVEPFSHLGFCFQDFWFSMHFHILLRRISWRKIRLCRFCTIILIVSETASVSIRKLPVSCPNNLLDFFVHAVLPFDSWPRRLSHNFRFWPHNSSFVNSARYFLLPSSFNLW